MSLSTWGKLKAEVQTDFDLWMEAKCKDGGEEKYCRLCEKREKRSVCGYGGAMWDKYTVDNVGEGERAQLQKKRVSHLTEVTVVENNHQEVHNGIQEKAVSRKQQRFMGLVRKAQKTGQASSPEVAKVATSMSKSDVKDFASTKHKGLPEKKKIAEGKRDGKGAKSKGYSLRDWFKGGGWVQTGGKYDGKPCAKQPGQKTKPYCRDADDRASMSKDERNKRAAKKRKEDPNPNRTGRAKNVTQEEMMLEKKDACYHKVKARYDVWPSAYASGALVKCRKKGAKNWGNKTKKEGMSFSDFRQISEKRGPCWVGYKQVGMKKKGGKMVPNCVPEELQTEGQKCWKGYEKKGTKKMFGKTYNNCVKKEEVTNEAAAWTRKLERTKRVDSTRREGSRMNARTQEAILRHLQKKLGTLVERVFVRE